MDKERRGATSPFFGGEITNTKVYLDFMFNREVGRYTLACFSQKMARLNNY